MSKKIQSNIIVNMPSIESKQNKKVEGKASGCISPLIAIAELKIAKPELSMVKKIPVPVLSCEELHIDRFLQ